MLDTPHVDKNPWATARAIAQGQAKPKIFVCSPLRAVHADGSLNLAGIQRNIDRAKLYCRLVMLTGVFRAFAPHVLYTSFLDEASEAEREMGIAAGIDDLLECRWLFKFTDTVSSGMGREITKCHEWGTLVLQGEEELAKYGIDVQAELEKAGLA